MTPRRTAAATAMPAFAPLFAAGTESVRVRWLSLVYETDGEVLDAILPAPLGPGGRPQVAVWIAEFIGAEFSAADGTKEVRPAYMQGGISVRCRHDGGGDGAYAVGTYVEGLNHGILGRELFGLPKKQARRVQLDETPDDIEYSIRNAAGIDLVAGRVALDNARATTELVPDWFSTHYTLKLIPSAEGNGFDISRLVRIPFGFDVERSPQSGSATLEHRHCPSDPLHLLTVASEVRATYGHARLDIDYGTYLDHVTDIPTFGSPAW
ncbi:acetoacetate decarboxylase family protein [Prescottella agglutinans]|uniref:Acetoacetate decarboxylase n=1 Tax=Prescottella agglutinans TaxID=1644129 RepID=A0ABT6MFX3_9NOCA|nr:acetoacetate decarboxylase family protein [Prescottella agglutinans]MDH6282696.1 acetoacetate decarboxylase [Prescottella agglutinans]